MRTTLFLAAVVAVAFLLTPHLAHAAAAGGTLPWDTGLTTLKTDLTGPVPFAIGIIGMAVAGATLVFSHELGRFAQTVCYLVIVVCFMCAAPTAATAFGVTAAMVA